MSHPNPLYDPEWVLESLRKTSLYDPEWESYCDEQANRAIFRDQCRSALEEQKFLSDMIQEYWMLQKYELCSACCLGALLANETKGDVLMELAFLRDILWEVSRETAS